MDHTPQPEGEEATHDVHRLLQFNLHVVQVAPKRGASELDHPGRQLRGKGIGGAMNNTNSVRRGRLVVGTLLCWAAKETARFGGQYHVALVVPCFECKTLPVGVRHASGIAGPGWDVDKVRASNRAPPGSPKEFFPPKSGRLNQPCQILTLAAVVLGLV